MRQPLCGTFRVLVPTGLATLGSSTVEHQGSQWPVAAGRWQVAQLKVLPNASYFLPTNLYSSDTSSHPRPPRAWETDREPLLCGHLRAQRLQARPRRTNRHSHHINPSHFCHQPRSGTAPPPRPRVHPRRLPPVRKHERRLVQPAVLRRRALWRGPRPPRSPVGIIFRSAQLTASVSVFGFLAAEEPFVSGNFGFKDCWLGLQWVRENISSFGG